MKMVISKDGTKIAYDQQGNGPAVILIDGAMCARSSASKSELMTLLAPSFTAYSYDRRGRGDSSDTKPYAVGREIDDIEALIDNAGGSACLYGISSGGALALEAAVRLDKKVKKLAVYEIPYNTTEQDQHKWKEYISQLTVLLAEDRRGDAVAIFMKLVGMPAEHIDGMRHSPVWPKFEAIAPTLAYDHTAIMGEDASVPKDLAMRAKLPALVMTGGSSYPFMHVAAQTLNKIMPNATLRTLEGQTHDVRPQALAPVLIEFFGKEE